MMATCSRKGFSLVEMIAASIILSSGVVTICALNTGSFTAVRTNRDRELAWELLDRQLTIIDCMGLDEFLELRQFSGEINLEGQSSTVYQWAAQLEEGINDNLYTITIALSWGPETRKHSIMASTVLNGTDDMTIEEEEPEEETPA
jgi:prepilin-type N-terminal cleavage/methylation domain-containing protein